ncbi:hypothetical protein HOU49_gp17 [Arthrobacter phage Eileen]|uniref:Uncharacterized protein n=2 Tax=Bridgettevirus TaxID=2733170 RepID=A0A3G2KIB4_9CAUD|nr:hypothetical protein HOU49_gp17 [Arthrobacter phage Eileen]YP_009815567.1 hypothetical protein HOU51_gp17 [Arthrobacter phage Peas]AYN57853.1 hypothetical protein PBI_EILEEN_17 [Arthrobacter phage Eileen]AYN58704.1 hypothetical protein PBI_PEAS_17 [Arthrobacter phage Peas]UVK58410.1 hypothetical protein SEA_GLOBIWARMING_17 [Arthrobacter phage GlobiWarming]
MTDDTEKKAPAKGKSTLQAALLLLVIGAAALVAGIGPMAGLFLVGGFACGIVGLIQRDSAAR